MARGGRGAAARRSAPLLGAGALLGALLAARPGPPRWGRQRGASPLLGQPAAPAGGPPCWLGPGLRSARAAPGAGQQRRRLCARAGGGEAAAEGAAAAAPPGEGEAAGAPPGGAAPSARAVIQALKRAVGPGAGVPPPEVVGAALRQAGVPITDQSIVQALVEAAGPAAKPPWAPSLEDMEAVRAAANSGDVGVLQGLPAGAGEAEPVDAAVREEVAAMMAAEGGGPSARDVVRALKLAAGEGLGAPPPEVVGAALASSRVQITPETVREALEEAAGPGGSPPDEAALQAALAAALGGAARGLGADPAAAPGASAQSPEEVVLRLQAAQAKIDGTVGAPPAEVVGVALHVAGVPTTRENVLRGLQQAFGRAASGDELRAALLAVAEEIASPGAYRASPPPSSAAAPPQSPEEVVQQLMGAAGPGALAAAVPPEVIGMALRAAGLEASRENVIRAFGEVGRQGATPPTLADVELAVASGAAPPAASR